MCIFSFARSSRFKYITPNMMISPINFTLLLLIIIITTITTSSSFSCSNPPATFEASYRSICRSLCRVWLCTPSFSRRPPPALTRCWRTRCRCQSARGPMRWRAPYRRPQEHWGRDCRPGGKTWENDEKQNRLKQIKTDQVILVWFQIIKKCPLMF